MRMHTNYMLGPVKFPTGTKDRADSLVFLTSLDFRLLFELSIKQLVALYSGLSHKEREVNKVIIFEM